VAGGGNKRRAPEADADKRSRVLHPVTVRYDDAVSFS
jgi:hypothetical protein